MANDTLVAEFRARVEDYGNSQMATVAKFKEQLDLNPAFAFEQYGLNAMEAAARVSEAARIDNYITALENGNIEPADLTARIAQGMSQDIRVNLSGSTNPLTNLMEQARTMVALEWQEGSGFSVSGLKDTFDRMVSKVTE